MIDNDRTGKKKKNEKRKKGSENKKRKKNIKLGKIKD